MSLRIDHQSAGDSGASRSECRSPAHHTAHASTCLPREDTTRLLPRVGPTPTGKIGDVKIISLHTDKDEFMVVEHNSNYANKVPPDQFIAAVVHEQLPTHCGFNHAEILGGWRSLLAWTDGGKQPTVAKI